MRLVGGEEAWKGLIPHSHMGLKIKRNISAVEIGPEKPGIPALY